MTQLTVEGESVSIDEDLDNLNVSLRGRKHFTHCATRLVLPQGYIAPLTQTML